MKNKICLILSIMYLLNNGLVAQSYNSISVKEKYDNFNQQYVNFSVCDLDPDNDANTLGDAISKVLDEYITMYQVTKDKAYLYKFIKQSICIIGNRHDYAGINSTPAGARLPTVRASPLYRVPRL